ncbi:SDR family NAD(P)-dependent oxidoreductase [Nostoc sp. ChiSLP03a]|uniref:SDR family NAD(P)-dependent oxidoreductase n=1 Tax=Nostoc sp. ChiSLP03a TaxID=3075380 RepID=UPI002AD57EA6|nr:SDR family NAD(P)-dependent oxidoreductase [Nostoc sp. ChiSLP03a]MDZ8213168.1 SDR family NAD(P)-dependent oxidoreductase [Nostoc sp. ChiSLP03a]
MTKPPRCIVCNTTFLQGHSFYTGLCVECGNLNFSKRQQTADLRGTIAVVTGARVKIGHGVALRLLRNGATAIATSRFPHDAAKRYATEPDFLEWQHCLQNYGLDLRHLHNVEQFTQHVCKFYPRLDIIINLEVHIRDFQVKKYSIAEGQERQGRQGGQGRKKSICD